MKKRKYHIIWSRILLICFVAGQLMIFAHQHNIAPGSNHVYSTHKNIPQPTVQERCAMCDVMHHNTMVTTSLVYFTPVTATGHVYKSFEYNFTSIQLILSSGRAPPCSNFIA